MFSPNDTGWRRPGAPGLCPGFARGFGESGVRPPLRPRIAGAGPRSRAPARGCPAGGSQYDFALALLKLGSETAANRPHFVILASDPVAAHAIDRPGHMNL